MNPELFSIACSHAAAAEHEVTFARSEHYPNPDIERVRAQGCAERAAAHARIVELIAADDLTLDVRIVDIVTRARNAADEAAAWAERGPDRCDLSEQHPAMRAAARMRLDATRDPDPRRILR